MGEPAVCYPVLNTDAWLDVVTHPADGGVTDPDIVSDTPCPWEDVEVAVGAHPVDGGSHNGADHFSDYADLDYLVLVGSEHYNPLEVALGGVKIFEWNPDFAISEP